MSGGHFEYQQYRLHDIAESIREAIEENKKKGKIEWAYNFNKKTIDKFKATIKILEKAEKMVQRVDWLLSGDDGEETFHERWRNEGLEE